MQLKFRGGQLMSRSSLLRPGALGPAALFGVFIGLAGACTSAQDSPRGEELTGGTEGEGAGGSKASGGSGGKTSGAGGQATNPGGAAGRPRPAAGSRRAAMRSTLARTA